MKENLSDVEKEGLRRGNEFIENGRAYAIEHATKPSTIGLLLASNPLALLAWYVHNRETIDGTLINLLQDWREISRLVGWLTESFPTSIYSYRQVRPPCPTEKQR